MPRMDDVIEYLLAGDPAIRWQVMRDLIDAAPEAVAAERRRTLTEGWGARLLAEQGADGLWDGGTYRPGWVDDERPFFDAWTATHFSLQSLREYGVEPDAPGVRHAIDRVASSARWEYNGEPYFMGEVEPCINGIALAVGAYFERDASAILTTVLATQHGDGGWNCWSDDPADPSSMHSTICALEGLWAWHQATGGTDAATAARRAGEEYLLERRLLWRRTDGALIDPRMAMISVPTRWFYDVLRALDYLRVARPERDPRCADAIDLLRGKRLANGLFPSENDHQGATLFEMEREREGFPSRWATLRALRVLRWWDAA